MRQWVLTQVWDNRNRMRLLCNLRIARLIWLMIHQNWPKTLLLFKEIEWSIHKTMKNRIQWIILHMVLCLEHNRTRDKDMMTLQDLILRLTIPICSLSMSNTTRDSNLVQTFLLFLLKSLRTITDHCMTLIQSNIQKW